MKALIILWIFLLPGFSGVSPVRIDKNIQKKKTSLMERNLVLEKQSYNRSSNIANYLSPEVKEKLEGITQQLIVSISKENTNLNIDSFVSKEIHRIFLNLNSKQTDLLKFYVLAKTIEKISNDEMKSIGEMSEMTSLRLQMAMDRRSKIISTLSQMMKKISTTQDILVQNIK